MMSACRDSNSDLVTRALGRKSRHTAVRRLFRMAGRASAVAAFYKVTSQSSVVMGQHSRTSTVSDTDILRSVVLRSINRSQK